MLDEYYPLLINTALFHGFDSQELYELLSILQPELRQWEKGGFLLLSGYENHQIGILLSGEADGIKTTPGGNEVLVARFGPGDVYGDVLSGSSIKSPVSVMAKTECLAVLFSYDRLLSPAVAGSEKHSRLLQNLVAAISEKYFALSRRLDLLILKSLRAKLCVWLLEQAEQAGADTFSCAFNRAALADYINCERSALSRELNRMRDEGLIELYKNSFRLLDKAALTAQANR